LKLKPTVILSVALWQRPCSWHQTYRKNAANRSAQANTGVVAAQRVGMLSSKAVLDVRVLPFKVLGVLHFVSLFAAHFSAREFNGVEQVSELSD